MYRFALEAVLRTYGFLNYEIHGSQKGYRNEIWPVSLEDGRIINVTFYKREAGMTGRIEHADAVSEYLARKGMPTRQRIDSRILQLRDSLGTTNIGVYVYLSGKTIPWEAYTMTHIKLLGKTMSNMHTLLVGVAVKDIPSVYIEYESIIEYMKHYFVDRSVVGAMEKKLGVQLDVALFDGFYNALQACKVLLRQQILHMDFVRGNILFDVAQKSDPLQLNSLAITGILDFEKTAIGHPVIDIARTLAFLLVDCKYKTAEKIQKYFLYSGYVKRGGGDDMADEPLLAKLVTLFLLHDFYKFLRHNPYESLHSNEHYERTKDMLLESGVIRYK